MEMDECDDLFLSDRDIQYRSLSIVDFEKLVTEFVDNKYIKDGTALCFQVFYKHMAHSIREKTFKNEYPELLIISFCINKLRKVLKFSSSLFLSYLTEEFITLPIEILWWLHKNSVVSFVHYCYLSKWRTLSESLLCYIASKSQHSLFVYDKIVPDVIAELLRHANTPARLFHLHYRKEWSSYCQQILNNMVHSVLDVILYNKSESFLNFFSYMQNLDGPLPNAVVKDFFKTVWKTLMTHNVEEFDIYSAYTYQELWRSDRISQNLYVALKEIFIKYCTLNDIIHLMENGDDKINWKYTLSAVAVCVAESPSGGEDSKDITSKFLQEFFKKPKVCNFIKCLLFARQTYMENNIKMDYSTWYSLTFGSRSNFKRKCSEAKFELLISVLIQLTQYESYEYLSVQLGLSLDAPLMCNSLIHNYKSVCRVRLKELDTSPSITYCGGKVKVLHLMEESVRIGKPSALLVEVMKNQIEDFQSTILPQLVSNTEPYVTVKQMLLDSKLVSSDQLAYARPDVEFMDFKEVTDG